VVKGDNIFQKRGNFGEDYDGTVLKNIGGIVRL